MKAFLKGLIYALTLCVIACGIAAAQYQPIPNYIGVGAGQKFRNDINNHLSGVTPIAPRMRGRRCGSAGGGPARRMVVYLRRLGKWRL